MHLLKLILTFVTNSFILQGPPGTGKTRTLRLLLNTQNLHHYKAYYQNLLDEVIRLLGRLHTVPTSVDEWMQKWGGIRIRDIPRILIVAPSNYAVDNIARRVMELGFCSFQTGVYIRWNPRIVRVGSDTQDSIVKQISLRTQAENLIKKSPDELEGDIKVIHLEKLGKEKLLAETLELLWRDKASRGRRDVGNKICELHDDLTILNNREKRLRQIFDVKTGKLGVAVSGRDVRRRRNKGGVKMTQRHLQQDIEKSIIREAQLVCTTLSSSGLRIMHGPHSEYRSNFDVCIVDEAGQATEPETLIPLQHQCKHVVLCGDPKQLPATVKSVSAKRHMFHRSMFERLSLSGHPVHFLDRQFRCHPEIYHFPSKHFYRDRVENGVQNMTKFVKPWHRFVALQPLVFFDIDLGMSGEERSSRTMSLRNISEAKFCVNLLNSLCRHLSIGEVRSSQSPLHALMKRVAVLTPYRDQVNEIRAEMRRSLQLLSSNPYFSNAEMSREASEIVQSIDRFQGQERDIVILSTVRAEGIGFVRDVQRMCVALTRGKFSLFIVGNRRNLSSGSGHWKKFFEYLASLHRIIIVRDLTMPIEDYGEVDSLGDDDIEYTRNTHIESE